MKRYILIAIGAAVLLASPASASHRRRDGSTGANTFSGGCSLTGTVRFQPPLTDTPQPVRDVASARGTCSGTLTDQLGRVQQLSRSPVSYSASDTASDVSCALGAGAVGTGQLGFPSAAVHFGLSETRVAAVAQLTLTGTRGGSAVGLANVSASAKPIQILDECAGSGLPEVPIDLTIETTPAISG